MRRLPALVLAALLHALPALAAPATPPLSAEQLARLPFINGVTLSPDGKHIAGLMNLPDGTVLVTQGTDGGAIRNLLFSDNKTMALGWARWVSNDRLIASVHYRKQKGGAQTRLVAIDRDGGEQRDLSELDDAGLRAGQQIQDEVVDLLPGDGRHILLALDAPTTHSPAVYKLDIESGRRRMVEPPQRLVGHWMTDAQHRVRLGIRQQGEQIDIITRDPDGHDWRTLWSYPLFSADSVMPLGFDKDPYTLFIMALHEGRDAVFSVDLRDPALPRVLRLAHPEQDLDGRLVRSPLTGEALGLTGDADDDGQTSRFWDPELAALAGEIDKALPGRFNRLIELSRDETRYLVRSSGNGLPGQYYIGDRENGRLALLAEQYPHIPKAQLVGKQAARITARDGLQLRAWITRPKAAGTAPGPLVLMPHGGPHTRDNNDFDPMTEFLASRGYTVLQVNFRGSSGYGHSFEMAGLQRWGLEMQDDLTDAVQWAIQQRIADPGRVCIVGGSYGGYAALMGTIRTPDTYRCAASINGVTDLEALIHHLRSQGGRSLARLQFGSFWSDSARLRATSPVFHTQAIKTPLLLIQGDADQTVPVEQARSMVEALTRSGRRHEYIEIKGAGHSLGNPTHRRQYLEALDGFLGRHLGDEGKKAVE